MRTPASIRGHPIHPMLVTVPIGLWVFSLVCDLIALRSVHPEVFFVCALYTMIGGILGALLAALFGVVDLLFLREPRVRRLALTHMGVNLAVVALYVLNLWVRISDPTGPGLPLALSIAGVALLAIAGWLGGALVHVHGVSVDTKQAERTDAGQAASSR